MKLSLSIRKLISFIKKPRRFETAFKIANREIMHLTTKTPILPSGKTEVPLMVKATVFPVPTVICGVLVDGRPNFNTLGNFGIISPIRPNPIIYISSSKTHYTNIGIRKSMVFSVNIPSQTIMAQTDYLGVVSGHTVNKSKVLSVFYGRHKDVPCLSECPLNYVCKVIKHIPIKEKDLFIAEIIESYVSDVYLKDGYIDIDNIEPLLYSADGHYRIPSAPVGKAFDIYKSLKKID